MMLSTASRDVLNSIYLISISIMERIIDENNRNSLSKIYQSAVRSLSKCPAAIKSIQAVSRREPAVASMEVIDFYEWGRALEAVGRGLKRLIAADDSAMVTITDCHSWTSVTKFLHSAIKPKVLPFASEREMLEGMSRTVRQERPATPKSFDRRRSRTATDNMCHSDVSEGTVEELSFGGLTALSHPVKLMNSVELMKVRGSQGLSFTVADFLEAVKVVSTEGFVNNVSDISACRSPDATRRYPRGAFCDQAIRHVPWRRTLLSFHWRALSVRLPITTRGNGAAELP
jgi:hypothetical protein